MKLGKKIGATYHIYTQKKQIILKPTYWYKMTVKGDPKLTPEEAEGIEKVEWKSDKAYQKAVSNTYPSLKRLLDTKRLVETK